MTDTAPSEEPVFTFARIKQSDTYGISVDQEHSAEGLEVPVRRKDGEIVRRTLGPQATMPDDQGRVLHYIQSSSPDFDPMQPHFTRHPKTRAWMVGGDPETLAEGQTHTILRKNGESSTVNLGPRETVSKRTGAALHAIKRELSDAPDDKIIFIRSPDGEGWELRGPAGSLIEGNTQVVDLKDENRTSRVIVGPKLRDEGNLVFHSWTRPPIEDLPPYFAKGDDAAWYVSVKQGTAHTGDVLDIHKYSDGSSHRVRLTTPIDQNDPQGRDFFMFEDDDADAPDNADNEA